MKYYHLSPFSGWVKIGDQGIRASHDGYIYMLTSIDGGIPNYVAAMQLGHSDYGIIEIDSEGITASIEPDLVAELTSQYQVRIQQELIDSKYLKQLSMYRTDHQAARKSLTNLLGK